MSEVGMIAFYIGVGFSIGFFLASVFLAGRDDVDHYKEEIEMWKSSAELWEGDAKDLFNRLQNARTEAFKEFAEILKSKVQKPEFPWEDFFICESDIDELLKEMGCDTE